MKTLNIEEIISSRNINSNEIINSTVDISKNSILFSLVSKKCTNNEAWFSH